MKAGDVLVVLDDYSYRLAVAEAEAPGAGEEPVVRQAGRPRRGRGRPGAGPTAMPNSTCASAQAQRKMGSVAISEAQLDESRQLLTQAARGLRSPTRSCPASVRSWGNPGAPVEEQADPRGPRRNWTAPATSSPAPGSLPRWMASSPPTCAPGGRAGPSLPDPDQPAQQREPVGGSQPEGNAANIRPGTRVGSGCLPGPGWRRRWEASVRPAAPRVCADPGPECQWQLGQAVQRVPALRLLPADDPPCAPGER